MIQEECAPQRTIHSFIRPSMAAANGFVAGVGAEQSLRDLPSRGYFCSPVSSLNPVALRVYVCDHDTSPPDNQFIQTDPTNILIRSLTLKKAKGDSKDKERIKSATDSNKGKRPAERVAEDKIVAKRVNMGSGASSSRKEGGLGSLSDKDIQGYTVEKLRLLLKERNLPRTGKKEELIARLKQSI